MIKSMVVTYHCDGCHTESTCPIGWRGIGPFVYDTAVRGSDLHVCPECTKIMLLSLEGRRCEPKAA